MQLVQMKMVLQQGAVQPEAWLQLLQAEEQEGVEASQLLTQHHLSVWMWWPLKSPVRCWVGLLLLACALLLLSCWRFCWRKGVLGVVCPPPS
jgi:hypothetical protein